MTHPDLDAQGHDLTARYALGPLLGRGGFGSVHRARDVAAGRDVAVKLLAADRQGAAVERFLREAAVAATLEHPGVVRVHAFGRHGRRLAIVYELVEGSTFGAATRTLPLRARAELVRDAARAVGHAHARGIVHRDLKPDNLLVGRDGRLRVADFGLAWHEGADSLTRTGAVLGTPSFMAPELFDETTRARATPSVDVWALGVVLYEALTGRLPFDAPDLIGLMGKVQHARVTPPRRIDPAIPPALEAVCLRALERDATARYPDGEALARALDDALEGRIGPATGSRAAPWIVAAVVVLAGVAALGLASRPSTSPPPADVAPTPAATTTEPRDVDPSATPPEQPLPDAPITPRQLLEATSPRWAVWVDDRRVLTGGEADDLRLWDAATGVQLRAWSRVARDGVRVAPGRVALASTAGLHVLDVDRPAPPELVGRMTTARQVASAASSGHLAVVGQASDGPGLGVYVVDPSGQRRRAPLPSDERVPLAVALSPDGDRLAVCLGREGADEETSEQPSVLGVAGGVLLLELRGAMTKRGDAITPGVPTALRFTADGQEVIAGTNLGQLGFIPFAQAEVMGEFVSPRLKGRAHEGVVRGLQLLPDGSLLSLGAHPSGSHVTTWDRARLAEVGVVAVPGEPRSLDVSPDGRALVIGTRDRGVYVRVVADAR